MKHISRDLSFKKPSTGFIPYAAFIDRSTLITKNGELMQTLKIDGMTYKMVALGDVNLRKTIRESITSCINSDNFCVWFHTVRKRHNLDPRSTYSNIYAEGAHKEWCKKNYWHDKYINELYITIIHKGANYKIGGIEQFVASFFYTRQKKKYDSQISSAQEELNYAVDKLLENLSLYGARRLEIIDETYGSVSESLNFLSKLIHLEAQNLRVPMVDISDYLANYVVAFGNDSFEVISEGKKKFGAILSIKQYHEVSTQYIEKLLQIPTDFIITQTLNFAHIEETLDEVRYQDYILKLSKDDYLRRVSGIENILSYDKQRSVDYGQTQMTIMLVENNKFNLDRQISRVYQVMKDLGITPIREDLNLENCYWSQLPANFQYIARKQLITTSYIAGFASLHNFPSGASRSKWGSPVALFRTNYGTPYFFNFHVGDNGHTFVYGRPGSGKKSFINFILTEATKFRPKIFILDSAYRSYPLVAALEGEYLDIKSDTHGCRFNPLMLPGGRDNKPYMMQLFRIFLPEEIYDRYEDKIDEMIDQGYLLSEENRFLSGMIINYEKMCKEDITDLVENLRPWMKGGEYGYYFDNKHDSLFDKDVSVIGINLSNLLATDNVAKEAILLHLMYSINISMTGAPVIVAIDEVFSIFDDSHKQESLLRWMKYIKEYNGICILSCSDSSNFEGNYYVEKVIRDCASKILMPEEAEPEYQLYAKYFGLSEDELRQFNTMRVVTRNFMLKQDSDIIIAELNLAGLRRILSVIDADDKKIAAVKNLISRHGRDPKDWLSEYFSIFAGVS